MNTFDLLLQNSDDIIVIFDSNLGISKLNEIAEKTVFKIFNIKIAVGMSLNEFPSKFNNTVRKKIEKTFHSKNKIIAELKGVIDEKEKFFKIKYIPIIQNGKTEGVLMVVKDITSEKKLSTLLREIDDSNEIDSKALAVKNFKLKEQIKELNALKAKLQRNENIIRALLNIPGGIVFLLNRNGVIEDLNSTAEEVYGVKREDEIGKNIWKTMPEELCSERQKQFKKIFETSKPVRFQDEHRNRHFENLLYPILSEDGVPEKCAVLAYDITERIKFEEELKNSEERLQLALKASEEGLWDWNVKTGYAFFSDGYFNLLGYSENESIISRNTWATWVNLLHPEDRAAAIKKLDDYINNKSDKYVNEFRLKTKTGKYKWMLGTGKAVLKDEKGNPLRVIGTDRDITERKLMENRLKRSEELYRTLVENLRIGVLLINKSGDVVKANNQIKKWFPNLNFEDNLKCYNIFRCENKDDFCGKCFQNIENSKFERELTSFKGKRIFRLYANPIYDEKNEIKEIIQVSEDITEIKKAEEDARIHQEQLIQADKMVSLGILVSGVAHEINNPNNFIILNIPLLRQVWESSLPILDKYVEEEGDFNIGRRLTYKKIRDRIPILLEGILDGAGRIKNIVKELKDFARQEKSDLFKYEDINDILLASINLAWNLIKKSTKKFNIVYGDNIPKINCNFQKLEQVIINLIENACQSLEDNNKGIDICSYFDIEENSAVIRIRDEGCGIPKNILDKISEPFFTTKREQGGTGLGLSVSSKIILNHKGKLEYVSEEGKGTEVLLKIPVDNDNK